MCLLGSFLFQGVTACGKLATACRRAVTQDFNKEVAQLLSHCHMPCLCQALVPLMIILQEATCNAGLSESEVLGAINEAKVFKGGGTLDRGEKKPEIEALSR